MIVSVSRRTDIPAFYPDWFFRRLEEKYVYVRNPMNPRQVSELRLDRDSVDCFVFWTKNPGPMMDRLSALDEMGYPYYFQFTLTAYGTDLEPGVADKDEMIKIFRRLSRRIGPERVVWRYDPVLLGGDYTIQYHREWFEKMCRALRIYRVLRNQFSRHVFQDKEEYGISGDFTSEPGAHPYSGFYFRTNCSQVRYKDEHLFGGNGPGRIWDTEGEVH